MNKIKEMLSCSLSSVDAAKQLLDWKKLRSHATEVIEVKGGYQLKFPLKLREEVTSLASKESSCCQFLDITTETVNDGFVLKLTSKSKKAEPIMKLISSV